MEINSITITNNGYVDCKSIFYSVKDVLNHSTYNFTIGTNIMTGEIDSGIWAVSYILSMYRHRPKDFMLFDRPIVTVNNSEISLNELSKVVCYMDEMYPLFRSKRSVKQLIKKGLLKTKASVSAEEVKNIFCLDDERFKRPLSCVGNERFRAMAAIAFAHGKEVFCFPWLSKMRFDSYHENLTTLIEILERLNKIVILPTQSY